MSALAISPMAEANAAPVEKKDKPGDFKGTLKTAQKKPPAQQQQAKKPVADDQPADDVAPQVQAQQLVVAQTAAKPDDLASLISAGKSLVGAAVATVDANDAVDQPAALEPVKTLANASDALPMTPLERAVHDVLERLHDDSSKGESTHDEDADDAQPFAALPGVTSMSLHLDDDHKGPAPVEAVREAPEPQQTNNSHVHLVIDDGERLVVTVAVRGDQVITHVRGDNAETAAALARNAGVLDDHLRQRGLSLGELQATHDQSQPEKRQEKPHYDQQEKPQQQPRFSMEENP